MNRPTRHHRPPSFRHWLSRGRSQGVTLIEMMVVMTGVAALLGLCVVTLQVLLRLETDTRNRLTVSSAIDRLADQFRADVHSAAQAQPGPDATTPADRGKPARPAPAPALILTMTPGRQITYQPLADTLLRIETEAGKTVRRDSFLLGAGRGARFTIRTDPPGTFVTLMIRPTASQAESDSPRTLELLALLTKARPTSARSPSAIEAKGVGRK